MATALFQVWHFIIGFAVEATAVVLITRHVYDITFQPTRKSSVCRPSSITHRIAVLTVLGTVLGLSYVEHSEHTLIAPRFRHFLPYFILLRTLQWCVIDAKVTSSDMRLEGRRYWSTIILNSRTMARSVWFHVPGEKDRTAFSAELIQSP